MQHLVGAINTLNAVNLTGLTCIVLKDHVLNVAGFEELGCTLEDSWLETFNIHLQTFSKCVALTLHILGSTQRCGKHAIAG